jgi:ATP-dependent DNA helicase RecG
VSRRYRNRRVGEFLKELDLTEGRSTGISKILNVMAANGSPPPEFETDEDRSYFLVRLPVHERAAVTQAGDRATPQVGTKLALSRHQVEILEKCRESTALVDLMVIADRSDRTKFRRQGLTPLIEAGLLEMTIPDKPTSSNQRYRLTDAGQRWLSQHRGSP